MMHDLTNFLGAHRPSVVLERFFYINLYVCIIIIIVIIMCCSSLLSSRATFFLLYIVTRIESSCF